MLQLLEESSPQFFEFDEYYKKYSDLLSVYSQAARSYVFNSENACFLTAQKARQHPIAIAETVVGVLTKCIGYKVLGHDRCSVFLK